MKVYKVTIQDTTGPGKAPEVLYFQAASVDDAKRLLTVNKGLTIPDSVARFDEIPSLPAGASFTK
jgi:hypothetical protein